MKTGVDTQVNHVVVGFIMKMKEEEPMREGDSIPMNPAVAG